MEDGKMLCPGPSKGPKHWLRNRDGFPTSNVIIVTNTLYCDRVRVMAYALVVTRLRYWHTTNTWKHVLQREKQYEKPRSRKMSSCS